MLKVRGYSHFLFERHCILIVHIMKLVSKIFQEITDKGRKEERKTKNTYN